MSMLPAEHIDATGDGPDPPPHSEPTAQSPPVHKDFDTSFSERLEKAELRRMLKLEREMDGAASNPRDGTVGQMPIGDGPRDSLPSEDSGEEGEPAKPSLQEKGETQHQRPDQQDDAGTFQVDTQPDRGSATDSSEWADHPKPYRLTGSQDEAGAPQFQPIGTLAILSEEEQGNSLKSRPRYRLRSRLLLLGSLVVVIAASVAMGRLIWRVTLPQAEHLLANAASSHVPPSRTIPSDDRLPVGQSAGTEGRRVGRTSAASVEGQLLLAQERIIALETARRAAQEALAQRDAALALSRAEVGASKTEARQQDTRFAANS